MLLAGALLFCIYVLSNSGRLHIVDEASLFAVTESLALRGQVDTNSIAWTQWVNSPGEVLGAFGPNGEVYSKKGPAPAFLAVPWYLFLRTVAALNIQIGMLQGTLLWNGVLTALTALLLWLTAVRLRYSDRVGFVLALLFGLGTIAWPYARQFFGEPLSALALLLCFSGILHWKSAEQFSDSSRRRSPVTNGMRDSNPRHWQWMIVAGIGAGLAVATVTAHTVLVAILGIYAASVFWLRRRDGWRDLAGAAGGFLLPILLAGGFLLAYNNVRFGNPFDTGYHFDAGEGFTTPIWQGFWGLVFSPYRSVFLHTPLFIASIAAIVPFTRRHRMEGASILALSIVLTALYSMWWMWWGGYAWGPRFLVPMTPLWILVLAPVVEGVVHRSRLSDSSRRRSETGAFSSQTPAAGAFQTPATGARPDSTARLLLLGFIGLAAISVIVQLMAVSVNFVNYETLLRSEFFPTDWENPLAYGPPAQSLGDFLLSPVFGQIRLILRGGLAGNSDLAWLWPNGHIAWNVVLVGMAAVATLTWQLALWWQGTTRAESRLHPHAPAEDAAEATTLQIPGAGPVQPPAAGPAQFSAAGAPDSATETPESANILANRLPGAPVIALAIAIPVVMLGTWLGTLGREPTYGTPGTGYQAVLADLCTADRPGDIIINTTAFGYHIPMNWLPPFCGRALPVYGYALNSMEYPETEQVLAQALAEADRVFFITAGVAPNAPENTIERWLATNAYKADDRWFDDHRLLRYATQRVLAEVPVTPQSLFLSDGTSPDPVTSVMAAGNSVTIGASRAPATAEPGAILPIEIEYSLNALPTADLRWFVQILASNGVAVAQLDTGPEDNYTPFTALPLNTAIIEKAGLQLPADLAPGDYQIIAGVYNPGAPGAPRLRVSDGREYLVLSNLVVAE